MIKKLLLTSIIIVAVFTLSALPIYAESAIENDESVEMEGYFLQNSSEDLSKSDTGTKINVTHIVGITITGICSMGITAFALKKEKEK